MAQGKRKIEALRNLIDAIDMQINFALENNDLASIFTPAPVEYIDSLLEKCDNVAKQIEGDFDSAEDLHQIRSERHI